MHSGRMSCSFWDWCPGSVTVGFHAGFWGLLPEMCSRGWVLGSFLGLGSVPGLLPGEFLERDQGWIPGLTSGAVPGTFPDWLPGSVCGGGLGPRLGSGLVFGLGSGLVSGLVSGLGSGLVFGFVSALVSKLVSGLHRYGFQGGFPAWSP